MPRRLVALLLAASAAAALGGCADGKVKEANDYVNAVNAAQTRFARTSEQLLREVDPADDRPGHNRAALAKFYGAVDGFVAELRRIEPPARVASQHERLIGAVVAFGGRLRSAGAAITSNDASRVLSGQERLAKATSTVSRQLNASVSAINDALQK